MIHAFNVFVQNFGGQDPERWEKGENTLEKQNRKALQDECYWKNCKSKVQSSETPDDQTSDEGALPSDVSRRKNPQIQARAKQDCAQELQVFSQALFLSVKAHEAESKVRILQNLTLLHDFHNAMKWNMN